MTTWSNLAQWVRGNVSDHSGGATITHQILETLESDGGWLTCSQISNRTGIYIIKVRDAMRRLEQNGWVRRHSERVQRELQFTLTETGYNRGKSERNRDESSVPYH
ncbi:hypothetical protein TK90_2783 (plasmid) [Thioalkalivibrio sp. K90mix]|uniref:winged helix-turn-helix transcriptional regulator n=1 Tax=Thioalkalivibrio sp. (strain K90mix) TaxID=396595 RepID=UPI0001C65CC0|nr:hypothetical protein TK90_2783 [Thioalkalivibrio sp. K90mix]